MPVTAISAVMAVCQYGVTCSMTELDAVPLVTTERLMAYSQLIAASVSSSSRWPSSVSFAFCRTH